MGLTSENFHEYIGRFDRLMWRLFTLRFATPTPTGSAHVCAAGWLGAVARWLAPSQDMRSPVALCSCVPASDASAWLARTPWDSTRFICQPSSLMVTTCTHCHCHGLTMQQAGAADKPSLRRRRKSHHLQPTGATEVCRHALGPARMQEALLTGKMYTPQEAGQNGIFHATAPDWEATLKCAREKVTPETPLLDLLLDPTLTLAQRWPTRPAISRHTGK